ncbi:MAG TPA: hypothetical protein VLE95_04775, partial [Chlamydiales bacterium]|nr:hypothetical protein [Chlamydiales bacterium]
MQRFIYFFSFFLLNSAALLGTTLTVNSSLDTPPGTSSGAATGQLRAVLNYANQNPGLSPFTV